LISIELVRPLNLVGAFFFAGVVGRDARKEIERFVGDHPGTAPAIRSATGPNPTRLALTNITFAYPASPESPVFERFSLQVETGEVVGLAGPSGSGKSTIARLVLGLIKPQAGEVTVGARDVTDLDHHELARYVAYLPQHPYIFSGSLRDNITLARPAASNEEIRDALRRSGLDALVESLPDGIEHPVSESGSTLSGGERMRVALARALLAQTPFLVLDEPMAELDAEWESTIWRELRAIRRHTGILVVAHRESTLRECDRIVRLGGALKPEKEER
jgi:ABC-type multidrug transport system fused ATPase/permease subunit